MACFIYYFILRKKLGGAFKGCTAFETAVFFALMRLCPLFMLESRTMMNYVAFASDAVILAAMVFVFCKAAGKDSAKTAAALYMFSPLPIAGIASGDLRCTAVSFAAAALLSAVYITEIKKGRNYARHFADGFILLTAGIYFILFDVFCRGFGAADLISSDKFPILIAFGILLVCAAAVIVIRKAGLIRKGALTDDHSEKEQVYMPKEQPREKFGRKNIIHILVFTAIYAVAAFWRLGSFEAPQTEMKFPQNGEIVIDLGEYVGISKLKFFLGYKSNAEIAVSAFNEYDGEWMIIEDNLALSGVFKWNEIPINWNLRYIGIVFTNPEDHYVREIVIEDIDGNAVTPVNASDYPELFDEQELYPKYDTYYYRMMFDEVYHGRTAYEFLNELPIYENTHPPLGKTIISLGIAAFGMVPFGWRFMSAVCGTLMVPIMYLFCWKLSHRTETAFVGTVLFCTEFMHFTLSRIATIDIIVALFILMMFLFMYCFIEELNEGGSLKKQCLWLVLCGISTALAVSTKWTGVYAALGIAAVFFLNVFGKCSENGGIKKNMPYLLKLCGVCVVSFLVLPAAVYCLSYTPFPKVYTDKNIVEHAVSNSISMFSYHSGVNKEHPYSSEWYEWIIDKRPLLDAITVIPERNSVVSVATFGNPFIAYFGIAALLYSFYRWRCKGCKRSAFLVILFLSMLMPWLFVHRTLFIYQYFVCMTLFCPIISCSVMKMKDRETKEGILLCVSLVLFIMFFPVISGTEADRQYVSKGLEWLVSWTFE